MKSPWYCAVFLLVCASLALYPVNAVQAQGQRGLELRFASPDTVKVAADSTVSFQLIARMPDGSVDTNWDQSGVYATLRVLNCTAETDTSVRSWNSRLDAYTWLIIDHMGVALPGSPRTEYTVTPLIFAKGVASFRFRSTKAESGVRLLISPAHDSISALSPPISVLPGALDNILVDLTRATDSEPPLFYLHRPVEVVVTARDTWSNMVQDSIPLRLLRASTFELEGIPGLPNPFLDNLSLKGVGRFYFRPVLPRPVSGGVGCRLTASVPKRWNVTGASDEFFYDIHPPHPFALTTPVDMFHQKLVRHNSLEMFIWQRPSPPDPYTGIRVFSASQELVSDTVRYTIHFLDAATRSREYVLPSDDNGLYPAFSVTQSVLANIIDSLSGIPDVATFDVIWYVEATDGDWVTRSTSAGADSSGRRMRITNEMYADKAVALYIPAPGPFTLEAGEEFYFELQAQTLGGFVRDWDVIGKDATLLIRGTTVDSDSSTRAWGADSLGYSWSRLTVGGTVLQPVRPGEYRIPPALFNNGRAPARYISSKAERNIRLEISPLKTGWMQQSPDISWKSGQLDNVFADITWPHAGENGVYVQREYEVVLHARDRFLNPVAEAVPVRLSFRYPDEIDVVDSTLNLDSVITINGSLPLRLLSTVARGADSVLTAMQEIVLEHEGPTAILSAKQTYTVLDHAPSPFSLREPPDHAQFTLVRYANTEHFKWNRPEPPDPFTDMRVSRYSDSLASDDLRYRVYIMDAATLTSGLAITSNEDGRQPQLTMTHGALAAVLERIAGSPLARTIDVLWYVEATDGLFTTFSDSPSSGLAGYRLRLEKYGPPTGTDVFLPVGVSLSPNYPNPFNPSTRIEFSTTQRGPVVLRVYNLLGEAITTLHDGPLDAGRHVRDFDAKDFPSGVYICRLEAEGLSLSTRMVLLR
ncbi:MAG: T9SS type A sorting domain-containing protein [Bacteroidia bacterium]|nr:T9SS type A sorting domain-containing protein [Bacteroidia bacterium]